MTVATASWRVPWRLPTSKINDAQVFPTCFYRFEMVATGAMALAC